MKTKLTTALYRDPPKKRRSKVATRLRMCWVCGSTKRLSVFIGRGGELVLCRDHLTLLPVSKPEGT